LREFMTERLIIRRLRRLHRWKTARVNRSVGGVFNNLSERFLFFSSLYESV
jgi:hypothetical protein